LSLVFLSEFICFFGDWLRESVYGNGARLLTNSTQLTMHVFYLKLGIGMDCRIDQRIELVNFANLN